MCIHIAVSSCPWGSPGKNTGVGCHFLLQWTMFRQNSSLWPVHLGWPCTAWLLGSLSYAMPFATTRLWSMKGQPTPVFLPRQPYGQYEKAKKYDCRRPPRLEGVQYAAGEEQKAAINSSSKNEVSGPKQRQHSSVDVSSGENKEWCYKEQHCIGTWKVRSMIQGKLDMANKRWQDWTLISWESVKMDENGQI